MKKRIILSWVFLAFLATFAQAQEVKNTDAIYVKPGGVFRGEIIKYKQDEFVEFRLVSGDTVKLAQNRIRKIVQKGVVMNTFENQGFYYHMQVGLNGGLSFDDYFTLGFSVNNTIGYQHNRWLGTGVGIGADRYFGGHSVFFIPVSFNVRGYVLNRSRTPYYSLDLGYGFAVLQVKDVFQKAKGGLMFHPSVGIRFGGQKGAFTLDFGVKMQDLELEYNPENQRARWWGRPWLRKVEKTKFMRSTVRIGWLF